MLAAFVYLPVVFTAVGHAIQCLFRFLVDPNFHPSAVITLKLQALFFLLAVLSRWCHR